MPVMPTTEKTAAALPTATADRKIKETANLKR